MKYIKLLILFTLLFSCSRKPDVKDPYQMIPPYKLLNLFSRKIKPETDLILKSYAYNLYLSNDYIIKKGIANFSVSYHLNGKITDEISLDYARNLIVFLGENLLNDINLNLEIRPYLDVYPFEDDMVSITIHFKDENKIDLGQGVAIVHFHKGKITYEGYNITQYRDKPPAKGKHYIIQEETYADALEIVKKQGTLKYL